MFDYGIIDTVTGTRLYCFPVDFYQLIDIYFFIIKEEGRIMKTWTNPVMQELDVKLTASSGVPSQTEAAGFLQNGWHDATYDSSVYEHTDGDCVIPKKDVTES